jgi:hypothetical protein
MKICLEGAEPRLQEDAPDGFYDGTPIMNSKYVQNSRSSNFDSTPELIPYFNYKAKGYPLHM